MQAVCFAPTGPVACRRSHGPPFRTKRIESFVWRDGQRQLPDVQRLSRLRRSQNGAGSYRGLSFRTGYALDRLSRNPKAPAAAEKPCTRQTLSSRPFYRAKMPSIATPVVNENRPAARMLPSWMTALGGAGGRRKAPFSPTAVTKRGRQFIAGFPLAPGALSTGLLVI